MFRTLVRESRKFPNVLLIDFGTLYAKVSVLYNGKLDDDILVVRNELYYISQERCDYLFKSSTGTLQLKPGFYTLKEIEDKSLLFQADEIFVQSNAVPDSIEILVKSYQNICEHVDEFFDLPITITQNYHHWAVVTAIAAFETSEARTTVELLHLQACDQLNFQAFYSNNQLLFDYFSQIRNLEEYGNAGYCIIVNIGGGDTEVGVVSGLPLPNSYRRFALGGQDITKYIQNTLQERYHITGAAYHTIEEWLAEGGTVLADAPVPTLKLWKRRKIDISALLNCPEMLFDWQRYWGKEREYNSVVEIITASIESLISQTETDIEPILSTIVLVGGAAQFRGIPQRIETELKQIFPEYTNKIHVFVGDDPQNSGINGIRAMIKLKYLPDAEGLLFILLSGSSTTSSIDWQSFNT